MKNSPGTETQTNFGWKHLIALIFSIGVTLLILIYQDKLRGFENYAYGGAFLAMLIGNSTVILPVPGLIVVYALGGVLNPLFVGLVAGPGAMLGEITGYVAGYSGSTLIEKFELYNSIKRKMERYGPIVITLLAAFPNPVFDLAGLAAGSMRMKWWKFIIATLIGKTFQAILIAYAGALSLSWIEQLLTR
jgi:uncharacterized membrane protein YdjX (TVP38/TMEM64 family)